MNLYLTPSSISDLTLFIFASFVAGYLWHVARKLRRRAHDPWATIFLAAAITLIAGYVLLTFLERSLYPDLGFYVLPPQSVAMALALVCLVQFAYRFPVLFPERRREARLALGLTMLLPLWEGSYAVFRYARLAQGVVAYRPSRADYIVAAGFLWFLIVLLRQVGRADERPAPLWRKLWRPQGRPARTTRAFALISLSPLWLMAAIILRNKDYLSTSITVVLLSLGILFTLLVFVLVYLDTLPEATSFMVKLVAISLAAILAILGVAGQMISPAFIAGYHNPNFIADRQTLRFTPNTRGGYDVARVPFYFDNDLGADLDFKDTRVDLAFAFPFYDQVWRQAYLYRDGAVSFGQTLDWTDALFRYGLLPAIFPLAIDSVNSEALLGESGGFFARNTAEKLTITWFQLPERADHDNLYTFQLTLNPDGSFETTFDGLPATQSFDAYSRWDAPWMLGVLPGSVSLTPQYVRFDDLPFSGGPGGIVEDYHLDFRRVLHRFLTPLAYLVLASTVLIMLGIPFIFRRNLVRPLNALLAGMREVDAGNLAVTIPVQYDDEFGSLTRSFNSMTGELQALVSDLENRVAERTADLTRSQQQTESLRQQLDAVLNSLDALIYVSDMQTHEILFANKRLQEVFGPIAGRLCWQMLQEGQTGPCAFCTNSRLITADGRPAAPQQWEQQNTQNGHWYATRDSAITWIDGRLVHLSLSTDITRLKNAESRLLSQQRALVVLEERSLIGQELHDRLGQVFGFLSIQSQAAQALFAAHKVEAGERLLARLTAVAQDSHSQIREFILGMKGTAAPPLNFWEMLPVYAEKLQHLYQMQVSLNLPTNRVSLLPQQEMNLLRIIQEALANVRQHSGVNQARVSFQQDEQELRLIIADEGSGFDPQPYLAPRNLLAHDLNLSALNQSLDPDAEIRDHLGLSGMQERAEALDGMLIIDSQPGAGTQVMLTIPGGGEDRDPAAMTGPSNLRVLLADDQPIFLEGLSNLLQAYGLHVVGMARDGLQAQEMARTTHPDVIVMDIHMPNCDGITATRRIKQAFPDIEIVVLSVSAEDETLFEALKAGASGYLLKNMQARDFFLAITGLENGIPPVSPQLAGKVLNEFQNILQTEVSLSAEQTRMLQQLAQGHSYLQIAFALHVSERTVKRYMKELMTLLHLRNRGDMETYARERGM